MKEKSIFWNIEIIFLAKIDSKWTGLSYLSQPICELANLFEVLQKINFSDPRLQNFFGGTIEASQFEAIFDHNNFKFAIQNLKEEVNESGRKMYLNVLSQKSFLQNLEGMKVEEFPTFYCFPGTLEDNFFKSFSKVDVTRYLNDHFEGNCAQFAELED